MNPLIQVIKSIARYGLESFGKYYSTYRGYVFDVEDPENLCRLKVIVPQVGKQPFNVWAWPKNSFNGKGYGSQCLPQKGDLVWVSFEGGCPEVPLWEHGHRGRKEIPDGDEFKDKKSYWFKTPKGNWVNFYDTKNLIHIENVTGNTLELNEYGIEGKTKKQVYFEGLDKVYLKSNKEIYLESLDKIYLKGTNKTTIESPDVLVSATSSIQLGGQTNYKAVLGDNLDQWLGALIDTLIADVDTTGGMLNPGTIATLQGIKANMPFWQSQKVKLD